jgi:hypothetical protein
LVQDQAGITDITALRQSAAHRFGVRHRDASDGQTRGFNPAESHVEHRE